MRMKMARIVSSIRRHYSLIVLSIALIIFLMDLSMRKQSFNVDEEKFERFEKIPELISPDRTQEIQKTSTIARGIIQRVEKKEIIEFLDSYEEPTKEKEIKKDEEYHICLSLLRNKTKDNEIPVRKSVPDATSNEMVLELLDKGCDIFRSRYRFVTEKESASQTSREELDFPIGYTIVFHDNIHQMSMLLSAIYRQHNLYCLHLDAKANGILKLATRMLTKCFSNIFVATKTERVVYASFSRLMADINCMRDMLGVPKTLFDWKYVINLCGQDFPLSTNYEIMKQLKELKGKNSIAGQRELSDISRQRTKFIHKIQNVTNADNVTEEKDVPTKQRHIPPPFNITILKNLAYNSFAREFLQWALVDSKIGTELLNWSSVTHTPDEHFWLMLSAYPGAPGGSSFVSWWEISRVIMWANKKMDEKCHGYWKHNVCVFGSRDIPWLMSRVQMFANKFDVQYDVTPLTCLRKFNDLRTLGNYSEFNQLRKPLRMPKQYLNDSS